MSRRFRGKDTVGVLDSCGANCVSGTFITTCLSDVAVTVVLVSHQHHFDFTWDTFFGDILNTREDVCDLMIMVLARLATYLLFWLLIRTCANPGAFAEQTRIEKLIKKEEEVLSGGLEDPLIQNEIDTEYDVKPISSVIASKLPGLEVFENMDESDFLEEKLGDLRFKRNFFVFICFLFGTFYQAYTGIKCVLYKFQHDETLTGCLYGGIILCINIESWLFKSWVEKSTKADVGYKNEEIHSHSLICQNLRTHRCDVCRKRIEDKGWRCKLCDWDICEFCMKKKLRRLRDNPEQYKTKVQSDLTVSKFLRRTAKILCKQWNWWTVGIVALLCNTGSSLLMPNYTGKIIDQVFNKDKDKFEDYVKIFLILSVVTGFCSSIQGACFRIAGSKVSSGLRMELFQNIILQDIGFFDKTTTGELTSRMMTDAGAMTSPMRTLLNTLISNSIKLIGGLFMCFFTSWKLSLIAFTTMAPIIYVTREYANWSRTMFKQVWSYRAKSNEIATETITSIRTVRAFVAEEYQNNRFAEATNMSLGYLIKDSYASTFANGLSNYLDLAAGVLILWYGGIVAIDDDGDLTAGMLVTFQLYWTMINNGYQNLQNILNSFTQASGAAERVFTLLDQLPFIDPDAGLDPKQLKGEIEFEDVIFSYPSNGKKVLQGINLHIKPGQVVAFVGKSGAGKSTIMNLLMRFYDPDEGAVKFDGVNIADYSPNKLRRQIGLVAQNTDVFAGTIRENIAYATDDIDEDRLRFACSQAHALEFIDEFEDGFDTQIGERGIRVSGGQRQRLAIARMLYRDPTILLLDEATSSLDTESEAFVQKALDDLIWKDKKKTRTIVLVAHRLSTVINADKICVVNDGKIVEVGNHEELCDLPNGIYSKLVSRQIQRQNNVLPEDAQSFGNPDNIDDLLKNDEEFNEKNTSSQGISPMKEEKKQGRGGRGRGRRGTDI